MRTKKLFLYGFASAMLLSVASCANDQNIDTPTPEDGVLNYMAVNLVSNHPSTKADPVESDKNYEDGIGDENTVTAVRLYFFDDQDGAFTVDNSGHSYVNATLSREGGTETPNVEKILLASAAVKVTETAFPTQVIAVLNPPAFLDGDNYKSLSLTQLNAIAENFGLTATTNFVMSNSVYADQGSKMEPVEIKRSDFHPVAETALQNPVTIHVERVLAKVALTVSYEANTAGVYNTNTKVKLGDEEQDIYVKFLGWNVTSTADKSYLMKSINENWADNLFGTDATTSYTEPWNYAPYFRSFWAINPSGVGFNYFNFGEGDDSDGVFAANAKGFGETNNFTYLQENAALDNTGKGAEHPSQVIIAAKLCDANGVAIPLADWGGIKYTPDGLLQLIAGLPNLWTSNDLTAGTNVDGRRHIMPKDIEFVTAGSLDESLMDSDKTGRYYVYAQLTETAKGYTWYLGSDESLEALDENTKVNTVNTVLYDLGHAKVWNEGYTYYYFDIRHLGAIENEPGYFGVVRNHVYSSNIKSLAGLGTPVFDPNEVIYPEKTEEEDTYIGAEIKILSWRIVDRDYDLDWK